MLKFLNKLLGVDATTKKPAGKAQVAAPAAATKVAPKKTPEDTGITVSRVDLIQRMWGDGFSIPGNSEYVLSLAKSLLLDQEKSVLDLTSGLGGFDRALAATYKTYVTGLERDKELAAAGNAISARTGFSRHAPITHYDPEKFDYTKRVDTIIAREMLYTIKNKGGFVAKLTNALKPKGHLLLTDLTCDNPEVINRPPVSLWIEAEPYGVNLISAKDMVMLLDGQGFDVRVNEDMSKAYSRQIVIGFANLSRYLQNKKFSSASKELLRKEVELWARRYAVLETGIKKTRFYAIKRS